MNGMRPPGPPGTSFRPPSKPLGPPGSSFGLPGSSLGPPGVSIRPSGPSGSPGFVGRPVGPPGSASFRPINGQRPLGPPSGPLGPPSGPLGPPSGPLGPPSSTHQNGPVNGPGKPMMPHSASQPNIGGPVSFLPPASVNGLGHSRGPQTSGAHNMSSPNLQNIPAPPGPHRQSTPITGSASLGPAHLPVSPFLGSGPSPTINQGQGPPRPSMNPPPSSRAGPPSLASSSQPGPPPPNSQSGPITYQPGPPPPKSQAGPPPPSNQPGPPPPNSQQPGPPTSSYSGTHFNGGHNYPPMTSAGGPPMMGRGTPQVKAVPPQMGDGPPQMGSGPPQMGGGPPQMGGGPPQMGGGPPQIGGGPPQIGGGPPQMGGGPPPIGGSLPRMGSVPPQMSGGPLQMGSGPPQMESGPPPMGGGPPQMGGGPPQMGIGPPQMGGGPPQMGGGPPQMGIGPPQMGGGPPPMGGGMPPMGSNMPPMGGGMPPMGGGMLPMGGSNPPMGGGIPPTGGGHPPMGGSNGSIPPSVHSSAQNRFGGNMQELSSKLGGLSVTQMGFQKMWGQDSLDLLQNRHILPPDEIIPPKPKLQAEQWNGINCNRDIFRCTLSKIPETDSLLKKARLPLGVLIHPYKDLSHLPVIQCSTIVRCRSCRTYINPFVHFVDQRRWRCNLCYRVNELPEEFLYDPVSKSYGDPSRRPECKSSTIEFIAPQEYMLRPPQPAVYLFLLDVSRQALESGYLRNFCDILLDELDKLPGDSRTQVGFITYNRSLQFYMIPEGASQASQLIVGDIDDVFLPSPSDLLINLQSCKEQIVEMLSDLPELFNGCQDTENCLGAALQAAYKMISPTGGRITVVQCTLPNIGPGAVKNREGSQSKEGLDSGLLNPSTDFYKKLALECSGQQIAVDCFVLNNQHVDLATISGISKFSGGQVQTFAGYHSIHNLATAEKFDRSLRRYLTRKIGFESVMRIRCTRGMSLHTFHGHFFVRSTDLLSLPNVNPDAGFGMQVSIDEDLKDSREVSFQAALLYTSSKGERRIRVHTLCVPISSNLQEIIQGADQQCMIGLLTKMAVDRSLNSSLSDAKEAFINACVDTISRWKMIQCISQPGVLPIHPNLRLLPLYILSLLKSPAFTARSGVKLDERTSSLIEMKCLPLNQLMQSIYPDLYRIDNLELAKTQEDEDGAVVAVPERLQLSAENISLSGVYLMDRGDILYLYLGKVAPQFFCEKIFNVSRMVDVDEHLTDVPELDNEDSERLRAFIQFINNKKSHSAPIKIIRDDLKCRMLFINQLVDDRSESSFSYYEFLQHLKTLVK